MNSKLQSFASKNFLEQSGPIFTYFKNVTKIRGKLWTFFLVMLRNRMQTRNYRFVWLCGASSSSQAVGVPHFNDGILGRFEFLRSSPAFFFQLCSWLLQTLTIGFTAKKSGITSDGWDPPFFDNEDTLVRWVWRHWKSFHKHSFFFQAIKCVYPDTFCPLCRLQKQFPLGNAKSLFFLT